MITEYVRQLLGSVPSAGSNYDYSILEYMVSAMLLLFIMNFTYRMLLSIFGIRKQ